jgi:hypothetical protein
VLKVLKEFPTRRTDASTAVSAVEVLSAGYQPVLGRYTARGAGEIPAGFADVCRESDWDVEGTWAKLNGAGGWFKHEASEASGGAVDFNPSLPRCLPCMESHL